MKSTALVRLTATNLQNGSAYNQEQFAIFGDDYSEIGCLAATGNEAFQPEFEITDKDYFDRLQACLREYALATLENAASTDAESAEEFLAWTERDLQPYQGGFCHTDSHGIETLYRFSHKDDLYPQD